MKGPFFIDFVNLASVLTTMNAWPKEVRGGISLKLKQHLNNVFEKSQELVPKDTLALQSTGKVVGPKIAPQSIWGAIRYGGPAERTFSSTRGTGRVVHAGQFVDYAAIVHYDMETDFVDGESLYVKKPLDREVDDIARSFIGVINAANSKIK